MILAGGRDVGEAWMGDNRDEWVGDDERVVVIDTSMKSNGWVTTLFRADSMDINCDDSRLTAAIQCDLDY